MNGEASATVLSADNAINLSPLDPLLFALLTVKALANLYSDDYDQAIALVQEAAVMPGAHHLIHMLASAIYAEAGQEEKAKYWRLKTLANNEDASIDALMRVFPVASDELKAKIQRGLRLAGFSS